MFGIECSLSPCLALRWCDRHQLTLQLSLSHRTFQYSTNRKPNTTPHTLPAPSALLFAHLRAVSLNEAKPHPRVVIVHAGGERVNQEQSREMMRVYGVWGVMR